MEQPSELQSAVCLELPLNVVNIDRAIEAVGGAEEIARVTSEAAFSKDAEGLQLRLRKEPFHHPVNSAALRSKNIVIEIELPSKCFAQEGPKDIKAALSAAKAQGYAIKAVPKYQVNILHRFREIADFQYYTGDSNFINKMKKSLFIGNLAEIQTLRLHHHNSSSSSGRGRGRGSSHTEEQPDNYEILPPPRFTLNTQPFYYGFKQSPYVKIVDDDESGEQRLIHTSASAKVISNILNWGDEVPHEPPEGLEKNPRTNIKQCISELTKLFSKRLSYTRRSLQHKLGPNVSRYLKYALPYVSYYYRSGPWRGAYIKYGADPSVQPQMAKYQVEHFRITSDDQNNAGGTDDSTNTGNGSSKLEKDSVVEPNSSYNEPQKPSSNYLFDGTNFPDVPLLQLCDISDGFLETFINTEKLRSEVDANDGWFDEKTIAVIRKVLRAELVALKETNMPLPTSTRQSIANEILGGDEF